MYAIRSYYVSSTLIGMSTRVRLDNIHGFHRGYRYSGKNGGNRKATGNRQDQGQARHVITSYSIHYTKLYDERIRHVGRADAECDAAQRAAVGRVGVRPDDDLARQRVSLSHHRV